jgi:two-component system phosphate regulon response regulator PhoB
VAVPKPVETSDPVVTNPSQPRGKPAISEGTAAVSVINIFLTNQLGETLEAFEHDGTRFEFGRLYADGPRRLVEGPTWAFVDWVMDDLAGLEMCRRLRADSRTSESHITMVLESDDLEDRRRALRAGADDYMVGGLDRSTVLDRVMALQSHQQRRHSAHRIEIGALAIDMSALQARWNGKPVPLRPNEFRLLRFFAENPDVVLSRHDLIEGLGKQEPPIDERTVDVWIGRLRRALMIAGAGNPLRTVRSLGYVFDTA